MGIAKKFGSRIRKAGLTWGAGGRWGRVGLLVTTLAVAGGWTVSAQSCCMDRACEQVRFLKSQIALGEDRCCMRPAGDQAACFADLDAKIHTSHGLILTAKQACDNSDDALVRDTIKQIRDLWLPKIIKSATGVVQNEMIALGDRDWIQVDATLSRVNESCKPVTVSVVGQRIVNPEATGRAAEDSRSASPGTGGPETVAVQPANAAQAYSTCAYRFPEGTAINLRFGQDYNGIALSGDIAISPLSGFPTAGFGDVGLPTDVTMTLKFMGQKLTATLDKTSPFNTLRLDAAGNGTLGVALTLKSESAALAGLVQVGSTIYFNLPVTMANDWSSMRLRADATLPGSAITPTVPAVLAGGDKPSEPITPMPNAETRCLDTNGNGIRDGADSSIHAIDSQLGCNGGTAQH